MCLNDIARIGRACYYRHVSWVHRHAPRQSPGRYTHLTGLWSRSATQGGGSSRVPRSGTGSPVRVCRHAGWECSLAGRIAVRRRYTALRKTSGRAWRRAAFLMGGSGTERCQKGLTVLGRQRPATQGQNRPCVGVQSISFVDREDHLPCVPSNRLVGPPSTRTHLVGVALMVPASS